MLPPNPGLEPASVREPLWWTEPAGYQPAAPGKRISRSCGSTTLRASEGRIRSPQLSEGSGFDNTGTDKKWPCDTEGSSGLGSSSLDEPQAPAGDLYLTCLRLRVEESGGWGKFLEASEPEPSEAPARAAWAPPLREDLSPTAQAARSPTWKEWAGRRRGWEGYWAGDMARGLVRSWRQRRRTVGASPASAFGLAGANVELLPDNPDAAQASLLEAPQWQTPTVVACRCLNSAVHAVAVTSAPLPATTAYRPADPSEAWPGAQCFYFELEVLELEVGMADAMAMGFAWEPPLEAARLPVAASALPRSLVLGGDLPCTYFDTIDLGRVHGWRPLVHVAQGSIVGALLEICWKGGKRGSNPSALPGRGLPEMRLSIFQDGTRRASVRPLLPQDPGAWLPRQAAGPHGVVDLRGGVRRVRLTDAAAPGEV